MFDLMPFGRTNHALANDWNELARNFFGDFGNLNSSIASCKTDIVDAGDHYMLKAELPGFAKEEIQIEAKDNRLTVTAQHKAEQEEKQENYIRKERIYNSFSRSFDISNIDAGNISADYTNGLLEVKLPKITEEKISARQIPIH